MAKRAEPEDGDISDRPDLEDASNVLLLAPSLGGQGTDVCAHLLARSPPERTNVLSIAYTETPGEFVDRWSDGVGAPPSRGGIVAAGVSDAGLGDSNWTVRGVENPGDLTGVGIELSEFLSRMANAAGDDEAITICFNNLTTLLQYAGLQRAFRFLHVVTGRVKTVGGVGHYHIDPDAHDQQTLATLTGLFDAVLEVDEDGSWSVRQ
jgi:hypothetical protein